MQTVDIPFAVDTSNISTRCSLQLRSPHVFNLQGRIPPVLTRTH